MEKLKIKFIDFWNGFNFKDNIVYLILSDLYDVDVIDSGVPDLLVCSLFGKEIRQYGGIKTLLFSGENSYPDFNLYDYSITCHDMYPERNLCIPYFAIEDNVYRLHEKRSEMKSLPEMHHPFDRKFCSCLISNTEWADPMRETLFKDVYSYRKIDSGGISYNTVGYAVPKQADILKIFGKYKFNIAAENSNVEGYVTEKMVNAFCACTIPIFYGNSKTARKYFNPDSYIDYGDFTSKVGFLDYLKEIDQDEDKYMAMLSCEPLKVNPDSFKNKMRDFLVKVVNGPVFDHQYGNLGIQNKLKFIK